MKYRGIALILWSPVRGIAVGIYCARYKFDVFTGADTWPIRCLPGNSVGAHLGLGVATERLCHRLPLNMEAAKEPAFHPHSLFMLDELLAIM